ncbi:craniofacial development protein 2-like [Octopus sinensis]|uniref:Craniofacial development protein 2-like n=1 Tax=Octopus sinensis TaxID=2607531 RepID=A0A6P7TSJ0_9MOLL|nr:craniofacial development protein 2-like [Octopus sinensis]
MCFIGGDWNARAGKPRPGETCIGSHERNRRNVPGTALIQFCTCLDLFLCNTAFRHPARHKTTWTGTRKDSSGNYIQIFNQIDYILCKAAHKHLLLDSRSYGGLEANSDHKLVITRIGLYKSYKQLKKPTYDKRESYNLELFHDENFRQKYANKLQVELDDIDTTKPANTIWDAVTSSMKRTALNVVGINQKQHKFHNNEIFSLSENQKALRLRIQNSRNSEDIRDLRKLRNVILLNIKKIQKTLVYKETEKKFQNIAKQKDGTRMFMAMRLLMKK